MIGGVLFLWRTMARGVGAAARAIGRNAASARELDAAHRRDGAALGIIALGLVTAIAVWFHAAGPVGVGLTELLRFFLGNGALALPVALFLLGVHMLRQVPIPGQRGRLRVGTVTLSAAVLGLLHLWSDSPTSRSGRSVSGGLIGAGVATPLERGLSAVVAVPLLFLLGGFGVLVLTATPLSQLVHQAWALIRWRPKPRSRETANRGVVLGVDDAGTGPIPVVTVPPDASENSPEPSQPARTRRPRSSRSATEPEQPPISRPIQLELNGGAGMYTLPSLKELRTGQPHLQRTQANDEVIGAVQQVFAEFGVDCAVTGFSRGPTVTRYEVTLGAGVKVERITQLTRNIAYAVKSPDVRIISPIPGKSAVGVEIPNADPEVVMLGDVLRSNVAHRDKIHLVFVLCKDVEGGFVVANLTGCRTCWSRAPRVPASQLHQSSLILSVLTRRLGPGSHGAHRSQAGGVRGLPRHSASRYSGDPARRRPPTRRAGLFAKWICATRIWKLPAFGTSTTSAARCGPVR